MVDSCTAQHIGHINQVKQGYVEVCAPPSQEIALCGSLCFLARSLNSPPHLLDQIAAAAAAATTSKTQLTQALPPSIYPPSPLYPTGCFNI